MKFEPAFDGGATWTPRSTGTTLFFNAVFFTDVRSGISVQAPRNLSLNRAPAGRIQNRDFIDSAIRSMWVKVVF